MRKAGEATAGRHRHVHGGRGRGARKDPSEVRRLEATDRESAGVGQYRIDRWTGKGYAGEKASAAAAAIVTAHNHAEVGVT